MARIQKREREDLQGHAPNELKPPTRPSTLKFLPSPNRARLGTNPLAYGPLGTFKTHSIAVGYSQSLRTTVSIQGDHKPIETQGHYT